MNEALTCDEFLGGRLKLWQPHEGYRAGADPVLLAAAVPAEAGQDVLELGCGGGAAILCLGARVEGLNLTGIELQPSYAALARRNADENGIGLSVIEADLRALPTDLRQRHWHHILMNPPYFDRSASTPSADSGRDTSLGGETPMSDWIDVAARRLRPKGTLTLIQRIERLPEALVACEGRLGSLVVLPLAPRADRAPKLFLLQARKGGRAAFHLSAPLVLHKGHTHVKDRDDYTAEARAILRDGKPLPLRP